MGSAHQYPEFLEEDEHTGIRRFPPAVTLEAAVVVGAIEGGADWLEAQSKADKGSEEQGDKPWKPNAESRKIIQSLKGGMNYDTAADRFGKSVGAIRQVARRARKASLLPPREP